MWIFKRIYKKYNIQTPVDIHYKPYFSIDFKELKAAPVPGGLHYLVKYIFINWINYDKCLS